MSELEYVAHLERLKGSLSKLEEFCKDIDSSRTLEDMLDLCLKYHHGPEPLVHIQELKTAIAKWREFADSFREIKTAKDYISFLLRNWNPIGTAGTAESAEEKPQEFLISELLGGEKND